MLFNHTLAVPDAIQQSFVTSLIERMSAQQDNIIKAREYFDGVHQTQLTDRTREYLNVSKDAEFNVNYMPMVVNAKADRLKVTGFECEDDTQQDLFWRWWKLNRMDAKQQAVHLAAGRDGNSFILVEWDDVMNIPRFHFNLAFAGEGVQVYYSDENRDEIAYASKQWTVKHGSNTGKQRYLNLYFPNRIEKYVSNSTVGTSNWMPYVDSPDDEVVMGMLGQAGVYWWTDNGTESGTPLGIPIVHFKANANGETHGTSDLSNVMPIQDAVNKSMIDLLAVMDTAGFGLLVGTGTDAWVDAKVGPGAVAAVNKSKTEADLKRLSGDDPRGLLSVYNAQVMEIARVSGTPLSYFQLSGQVAAEGTLKQQESVLISQIEKRQTHFGNAWEDCMIVARRLHNAFGRGDTLDDMALIDTVWAEAEVRNDKEQAETLAIKVEKLGVSKEQAQVEMGYKSDQIATFQREAMRDAIRSIRNAPLMLPAPNDSVTATDSADDNTLTQTESGQTDDSTGT